MSHILLAGLLEDSIQAFIHHSSSCTWLHPIMLSVSTLTGRQAPGYSFDKYAWPISTLPGQKEPPHPRTPSNMVVPHDI